MGSLITAMRAAYTTFRKEYFAADADRHRGADIFGSLDARLLRYALFGALYDGTAYDSGENAAHGWSHAWKAQNGIYRPIRGVFNPAFRTAEVNVSLLHGGTLDPDAGDGSERPTALPIETDNDLLRPAIGQLWRDSSWQGRKSIWTRNGIICGETPLKVIDDPAKGRVSLRPIHPRSLLDWTTDDAGNVRSYVIEERRDDPLAPPPNVFNLRASRQTCVYTETCHREGDMVVFTTYRDQKLYAWNGVDSTWKVPYGFVPMVIVKHLDFGHPLCGMGEYAAALTKIVEGDDLGSKLGDSVRQAIEAVWFFAGFKPLDIETADKRKARTKGEKAREGSPGDQLRQVEKSITATDPQAKAQALVAEIDVKGVAEYLQLFLNERIQDYPELKLDRLLQSGDVSGETIRQARKPAEAKLQERRPGYDDGLVRAMQMAIAIGGFRGYQGYQGFGLDSYASGDLAMRIGHRGVYATDPLDQIAEDKAAAEAESVKASAVKGWVAVGLDFGLALKRVGMTDDQVAEAVATKVEPDPEPKPGEEKNQDPDPKGPKNDDPNDDRG
jgi:hypothetical protein